MSVLAVVASVVAGPAAAQDLQCDRPDDVEVRSLEFRGNQAISDEELALRVLNTATSGARRYGIPLGTRRCLDREQLPLDVLSLLRYYQLRGFRRTTVDTAVIPAGPKKVRLQFLIAEGPPVVLRSYRVQGLDGLPDSAAIMNATRLRTGRPFDIELLTADKDSIVRRLRNAGYYRALVVAQSNVQFDSLLATASLRVVPGRRARFGEPRIAVQPVEGRNQQIPDDVVKRVMGINPGSLFSDRAIVDAQRSLYSLGTYRHIEVAPLADSLQPPGDSVVLLGVQLAEDYMRQLDSEFGWATLDCGRVRLQYTDRNWFRSARRFEMTGQASKIGYGDPLASETTRRFCDLGQASPLVKDSVFSGVLHYHLGVAVRQPRLLGFRWTPAVALYTERRGEYTAYLRTTYAGADLSATREIGSRMPLRLGYTVEYGKTEAPKAALCALFSRCNPSERTPLDTTSTLGVLSASIARTRTDNLLSPTRGYLWRAEVRSSASTLLGTSPNLFFNKAVGDVAAYRALSRRSVLAMRLRAGAVVGRRTATDSVGFVPPQERLYAGGATSVRGFQQNELGSVVYATAPVQRDTAGPRSIDTLVVAIAGADTTFRMVANERTGIDRTVPLGGNSLLVMNLDYRISDPFFFPNRLQYTVFVDAGAVGTRTASDLGVGLGQLKWTPGVGLRMLTPIGPLQVNVGYNRYPREEGPLYYNPNVSTLNCISPLNTWELMRAGTPEDRTRLVLRNADAPPPCPAFRPPPRNRFLQKLTFTFSIGSDF